MESPEAPAHPEVAELHPLTPEYKPEHHAVYFTAIQRALNWAGERTVRNIALTGSYGVGKSSILRQFAGDSDLHAIQVSLSTLGFEQATKAATAEDGGAADDAPSDKRDAWNPLQESTTNQIQKAIVKQLLYTQLPEKMPGSRYRRTAAFRWWRELLVALAFGIPLACVFFLFGWTARIAALFAVPTDWAVVANAGMAILASVLVLGVRYGTHNKLRIDSVSAGAATIRLSANSDSYFDEYLDEIVYFFQVVKTDIVIFEDIDRFEDPHIFETLRELNTILNGAKQLKGRVIRFIYAIKDSIFEELGIRAAREVLSGPGETTKAPMDAAILEVARANRTKFFDLVIPVVPFITHQTARELMTGELKDVAHEVSDDLIDLVAQHVPDMRLITNIRNEFVVFHEQVIAKSSLELSDDQLFAMVLYKNTHLTDFELIRLGTSNLDTLYRESRKLIQDETARLNVELAKLRRRLHSVSDQSERADEVGTAVEDYIALILGHTGYSLVDIRHGSTVIPTSDLHTADFWQKYAAGSASLGFTFPDMYRNLRRADLTREELERATDYALDPSEWEATSREDLERMIATTRDALTFFSSPDIDMSDLMARADVTLTVDDNKILFSERAGKLLGSRLATDMVAQGYIDRYFTLYTSTFPGDRVNANAMNFILKNVDADVMDLYVRLTESEAKAILRERPRLAVSGKSAYNLDFVGYLLGDEGAAQAKQIVLANLQRNGGDEKQFLQAFFTSERDAPALAQELARTWPNVLVSLIEEIELDDILRLALVDAALSGLSPDTEYAVNEAVSAYIADNHAKLTSFRGATADATAIAHLLSACEVDVPDLSVLSEPIRVAVVTAERFAVTRANVLAAIAPKTDLSLNALHAANMAVYDRVIHSLDAYLDVLEEDEATIKDPRAFVAAITEIDKVDRPSLRRIVAGAVPECRVDTLSNVTPGTWPALAANNRFPASFANVVSYVEQWGVDDALANVLTAGVVEVPGETSNGNKLELALKLLNSAEVMPSADLRANLIESLRLDGPMTPDSIHVEHGELIGRLIEHGVVDDSAESFALLGENDWAGLEFAITVSAELPSFIDVNILPPTLVTRFLDSTMVPANLKAAVVGRFNEFSEGADRAVVRRMATYALDHDVEVEWAAVKRVAQVGAGSAIVLPLVQRFDNSVTIEALRPVLTALGEEYSRLLDANGHHPRVPNTPVNVALLQRLKRLGTVNTFTESGSRLKVNMKRS